MVMLFFQAKKTKNTRNPTIKMITQNTYEMQVVISDVLRDIPVVLTDDEKCLYFLTTDIDKELQDFIFTGKTKTVEFQTFSKEDMESIVGHLSKRGLMITYHRQRIEYMHNKIEITFPQVSDPITGIEISIIPWFMLIGRPYPIFTYIYAIWHYHTSNEKSQRLSAAAAGKIFGVSSFNKSTLCRNMKAMKKIFNIFQIDRPLSTRVREAPSIEDMVAHIPKILKEGPSIEMLKEMYGDRASQLPERINNTGNLPRALSGIPHECSNAIKDSETKKVDFHDNRTRPARPRKKGTQRVQRKLNFVEARQIEWIRKTFITSCQGIVMDAAIIYHQLLL